MESYERKKRDFEDGLSLDRKKKELARERAVQKMCEEQEQLRREVGRTLQIRENYHNEERLEQESRSNWMKNEKRLSERAELAQAYVVHQHEREEKKQLEMKEEQRFREELMETFAREDRVEQMNDHKRRMKVQEHKREVERQLQRRRDAHESERQQEIDEQARLKEAELTRLQVVGEERMRLLKEYARPLKEYLPKGVAAHEFEFQLIEGVSNRPDEAGDQAYSEHQRGVFAESHHPRLRV